MESKIHSIIITSILAFALIAGIPAAFVSVLAQGDGGMTGNTGGDTSGGGTTGGDSGMGGDTSDGTGSSGP